MNKRYPYIRCYIMFECVSKILPDLPHVNLSGIGTIKYNLSVVLTIKGDNSYGTFFFISNTHNSFTSTQSKYRPIIQINSHLDLWIMKKCPSFFAEISNISWMFMRDDFLYTEGVIFHVFQVINHKFWMMYQKH